VVSNPEFFYQARQLADFRHKLYCLTALVSLLGPAKRVSRMARITYNERVITNQLLRSTHCG
jgi:hypothetical protein